MSSTTVFRNGTVWTGDGAVLPDHAVTVTDGRIVDLGPAEAADPAAAVLDLAGRWLLPGLIDLHTHLTLGRGAPEEDRLHLPSVFEAVASARDTLQAGITGCRDVGGHQHSDILLRDAVEGGEVEGPRIRAAGKPLVSTGGHIWYFGREADGPAEVRKAVREQTKAGADLIKVMLTGGSANVGERPDRLQLQSDELDAAFYTAGEAGLPVAVHAHTGAAITAAATRGASTVEHGALLDDDGIEAMLHTGCALVPTQAVYRRMARNTDGWEPRKADAAAALFEAKQETLAKAIAAGVRIGIGTDSGRHFPHGHLVAEMLELADAGMRSEDVLVAATVGNAQLAGLDTAGAIRIGHAADLVVVASDPREDLQLLERPQLVVAAGKVVHQGINERTDLPKPDPPH